LAVAGVQVFQRQFAVRLAGAALAHQHHAGAAGNQQRHGVANRRAVGHVAAQRALLRTGKPAKRLQKLGQLRAIGHQGGKGVGQGDGGADGDVVGYCSTRRSSATRVRSMHLG
jgi:hypothetical protein